MPNRKLTRDEAWRCVEMFLDGVPMTMFSHSQREAIKGQRFKWDRATTRAVQIQLSINQTRSKRRWTWQQVKQMRRLRSHQKLTIEDIRRRFGGSYDAVKKAVNRVTYKDVEWN